MIPGMVRSPGEGIDYPLQYSWASLVAQLVKNLPAMHETRSIPGLGRSPGEGIDYPLQYSWTSAVAQMVKNLPEVRETWVRSLGWEDLLAWQPTPAFMPGEPPWTEEPGGLQSMGSQRVGHK